MGAPRTGYLIPGRDGDGGSGPARNSSAAAAVAAVAQPPIIQNTNYPKYPIIHCCNVHNKFTCISSDHNKFIISKGFLKAKRRSGWGGASPGAAAALGLEEAFQCELITVKV